MSEIRAIVRGTATNYEAFTQLAERVCAFVEANEPGTLRYECFVDEEGAQFVWHEVYQDASAYLTHGQNMQQAGVMDEVVQLVEFEGMTVLGDVKDPEAQEQLTQLGAVTLHRLLGVTR